MEQLLLRVDEAAKATGIGRSKAYELIRTGEWQSIRIGRSVRISAAWLREWVERQQADAENSTYSIR